MSDDPVYTAFLETAAADANNMNRDSDTLRLLPGGAAGDSLPDSYLVTFRGIEHLVAQTGGTVGVSDEPIPCTISFPPDYCRSGDPNLLYRVVHVHGGIFHPSIRGATLCLGKSFRPGTRLRALAHQLYRVVACQDFATDFPLNPAAASYYLAHLGQIRSLKARPLWRRRVAAHVRRHEAAAPTRNKPTAGNTV